MRRPYDAKHASKYASIEGNCRRDKIIQLKQKLGVQQQLFVASSNQSQCAVKARFAVAHIIAKSGKPFAEGELVKECLAAVADIMCLDKRVLFDKNKFVSTNYNQTRQ